MRNKNVIVWVAAATAALALSITEASAAQVQITRINGYFTYPGGEFTITPIDPACQWWGNYGPRTHDQLLPNPPGDFQSFCLEHQEGFLPKANFTISDRAILGGVGLQGDPISIGTAWLYWLFVTEQLQQYDYTPGLGRSASAQELQRAIWWLEDENGGALADWIKALLEAEFGDEKAAKRDSQGAYNVRVLNIWGRPTDEYPCGEPGQDMLVLCVPDGGITLMLLGISVGALAFVSRKIRK